MAKKRFLITYYLIALFIFLLNSVWLVKNNLFFSIDQLPQGNMMYSVNSPDNLIRVDVYQVNNSLGSAVRISATEMSDGKARNIYWQTDISDVVVRWNGNGEVIINELPINIPEGGYYDCRRGFSIILEGSLFNEKDQ